MGLDDLSYPVTETVSNLLSTNEIVECYSCDQTMMTAEGLERNETRRAYNGYSLAFHMLFSLDYVCALGMSRTGQVHETFIRRLTRIRVLTMLLSRMSEGTTGWVVTSPADDSFATYSSTYCGGGGGTKCLT